MKPPALVKGPGTCFDEGRAALAFHGDRPNRGVAPGRIPVLLRRGPCEGTGPVSPYEAQTQEVVPSLTHPQVPYGGHFYTPFPAARLAVHTDSVMCKIREVNLYHKFITSNFF